MYTKILKELIQAEGIKQVYIILKKYTREYGLSYNQVEYLLHQYNDKKQGVLSEY